MLIYCCLTVDGQDYNSGSPQEVTIPAGSNRACVNYTIIDDEIANELNEQFEVMFTIPNAAEARLVNITDPSSTVTIVDNDGECGYELYVKACHIMLSFKIAVVGIQR